MQGAWISRKRHRLYQVVEEFHRSKLLELLKEKVRKNAVRRNLSFKGIHRNIMKKLMHLI
jgi:hypothetical protein